MKVNSIYRFNENGTIQWAKGFDQYHVIDQVSSVVKPQMVDLLLGRRNNSALLLKTNNNGNEEWYKHIK